MTFAPRSPGAPTLVLVPTARERVALERAGGLPGGLVELAGFGPIAAAARAAALVERLAPRRVLLVGIGGTYDPEQLAPGTARALGSVRVDGVGAGEGLQLLGPADLLPQWHPSHGEPIVDELPLEAGEGVLVTACAAADGDAMAQARAARHPGALVEDMEGFAVAAACALTGVPCGVVRGVSNLVGDRDHARWRIDEALDAAREVARGWLEARREEDLA